MAPTGVVALLALVIVNVGVLASEERPTQKVVRLLKEMQATLEKEGEEDQKIYDDMVCWCTTNEQAKTKAVADGIALDKKLTALIPELAAKKASLQVEIEQLEKAVKKNEASLAEATEIRAKELGEFREEETTAVQSVTGLKNAIRALSKNSALSQETLLQVRRIIQRAPSQLSKKLPPALRGSRSIVESFLQQKVEHKTSAPSSEILGILKGMKESFETNLKNSQQEEADSVAEFGQLKEAKTEEISADKAQLESNVAELAATGENLVRSKEDLEDTRAQVSADQKFLMDLQQRCGTMDKEFADRSKVRNDEIGAVNEALKIITDDDARDALAKTSFLQVQASEASPTMSKKSQALRVLRNTGSPKLVLLAIGMKDDVFAKIKVIVDDLIESLKKEQADEVTQKDMCVDDLNTNEKEMAEKNSAKKDLETKLESDTLTIEKLRDEIDAAKAEIADTEKEKLKASENRELENKDFQTAVTDQRATQTILNKALKKLQAFYAKEAALVQVHSSVARRQGQAPPPSFAPYKKSEGATGVVGMIENIIAESKQAEAEAVSAETEAQAAYESFMSDSKDAIDKLTKSISDKTKQSEKMDAERLRDEADLKSLGEDIEATNMVGNRLHGQCDFLVKNFQVRQADRSSEIEALQEAKALMSE